MKQILPKIDDESPHEVTVQVPVLDPISFIQQMDRMLETAIGTMAVLLLVLVLICATVAGVGWLFNPSAFTRGFLRGLFGAHSRMEPAPPPLQAVPETAPLQERFETAYATLEKIDHRLGAQLRQQLRNVDQQHQSYLRILATRFDRGEITYQRFYANGETLVKALVQNVCNAALQLLSVNTLHSPIVIRENKAHINEQANVVALGLLEAEKLFDANETALTTFARTMQAMAATETERTIPLEAAEQDMHAIAARMHHYSAS